jgi:hypothetical protein
LKLSPAGIRLISSYFSVLSVFLISTYCNVSAVAACRFRIQKKAEQIAVILPWEQGGNRPPTNDKPSNGLKSAKPVNSSVGSIGGSGFVLNGSATSVNNHYGRLESKLSGGAIITNMAATTNIDNKVNTATLCQC